MAHHHYTEEELQAKKYTDLFKISKELGIKTGRRLKTDKLIEVILKWQREEAEAAPETAAEASLTQDAEAVVKALGGGTQEEEGVHKEKKEEEEMLLDVQFPDCGSQDSLNSLSDLTNTSSEASEVEVKEAHIGRETGKTAAPAKRRKRRGTYDVDEEEEQEPQKKEQEAESGKQEEGKREEDEGEKKDEGKRKKRERSSTFELPNSNDATLPIEEKEALNNSKQLNQMLVSKVTLRGSQRKGTPGDQDRGSRKVTPRLSLTPAAKRRRESVTITPSAPAPALRPSRKSRGTPVASPALSKAAATTTTTTTAVTSKPVFTIGRGDKATDATAQEHKQGGKGASSGIPRFLSYARRLKVPNFARIHEKAFQRMEGLDDYVDKRKARQDTVSSTSKTQQPKTDVFQPSVTTVKNLDFNFAAEGSAEDSSNGMVESDVAPSSKPPSAVTHQPSPKNAVKVPTSVPRGAKVPQKGARASVKPGKLRVSSAKPDMTRKSPRATSKVSPKSTKKVSPKSTKKTTPKSIPGQKVSPKTGPKGLPQTGQKSQSRPSLKPVSSRKVSTIGFPVFGSQLKENQKPGKQSIASPMIENQTISSPSSVRKRMQDYSRSLASRGTGYVPYKGAVKPLKDRSELKNMAERKPKVKSSKEIREGQRGILKGVRLNKRFELQMANRGITL